MSNQDTQFSMTVPLLFIVLMFASLSGCQGAPGHATIPMDSIHATTTSVSLSNVEAVKRSLYAQLKEWKSVRYDYGGLSKKGVDCSGFVYLTYLENFGLVLPRAAVDQSNLGRPIEQRQLLPGDLVFFITGRASKHVGIFVEDRQFIHASKSRGVMLSSLDDVYWSKKYWKAKRINANKPLALHRRLNSTHYSLNVEVPRVCWSA